MPLNKIDRLFTDEDVRVIFTDPPHMLERPVPTYMYDEGADQSGVPFIRAIRVYITTVQAQGLAGQNSDLLVLAHARRLGCTLIVNDKAFKQHHVRLMSLGLTHAGIIWIKRGLPPERLVAFMERMQHISDEKEVPNLLYNQFIRVK